MNVLINTVNIDFQEATVNGMPLPQDGAKITNGRQFVGKDEKKHERGESFSFVL